MLNRAVLLDVDPVRMSINRRQGMVVGAPGNVHRELVRALETLFGCVDVSETADRQAGTLRVLVQLGLMRADLDIAVAGLLMDFHVRNRGRKAGVDLVSKEAAD